MTVSSIRRGRPIHILCVELPEPCTTGRLSVWNAQRQRRRQWMLLGSNYRRLKPLARKTVSQASILYLSLRSRQLLLEILEEWWGSGRLLLPPGLQSLLETRWRWLPVLRSRVAGHTWTVDARLRRCDQLVSASSGQLHTERNTYTMTPDFRDSTSVAPILIAVTVKKNRWSVYGWWSRGGGGGACSVGRVTGHYLQSGLVQDLRFEHLLSGDDRVPIMNEQCIFRTCWIHARSQRRHRISELLRFSSTSTTMLWAQPGTHAPMIEVSKHPRLRTGAGEVHSGLSAGLSGFQ